MLYVQFGPLGKAEANYCQIYAASQVTGTEVKEARLFSEANEWLSIRR